VTKHDVQARIIALLEQGKDKRTIASELGMNYQAVRGMVDRMIKNGQLDHINHARKVRDPRYVQRVLELYREGHTVAQISVRMGRKMSTVYAVIREMITAGAIDGRGHRGRPPTPDHILERIERMTADGHTIAEISVAVGRSFHHIVHLRARLRAEGRIPPSKRKRRGLPFVFTPDHHAKIMRLHAQGQSLVMIGLAIGVCSDTVKRYLNNQGLYTERQVALMESRSRRSI
jgi:DNA-binding NarL/FixJ family response regulator